MASLLRHLAVFFFSLGGLGLLLLGILDSSFLFMPLGNDLLVVALTARNHAHLVYYVAMATAGSVIGVALTHWVSRKGGEKGLDEQRKSGRIAYIERKVSEHGGIAIAAAALMPPPFPFTPVIVVAAALQYPLKRMLAIIASCRALRFSVEAILALIYGRRIVQIAQLPVVQGCILALVAISTVGSIASLANWVRKSRRRPRK